MEAYESLAIRILDPENRGTNMLATGLFDWLGKLDVDVITIVCITGAAVVIFGFVAQAWRRVREYENRAALVGMMIQRGMSVADIERVMQACVDPEDEEEEVKPDVRIITLMKENEYEGNDIERVLDAARIGG